MKDKKISTFVYDGLGVPVKLVNVPMKKMLGEWFIDINMETLQRVVLEALIHKPVSLTGAEIRYIRKYMGISTTEFGDIFGVSHVSVVKWENSKNGIAPALELCIRLQVMNYLKAKDKEFRDLYNEINLGKLKNEKKKPHPIIVDVVGPDDLKIAL
jgi:DNA-binding transcriptional regulator YiaG